MPEDEGGAMGPDDGAEYPFALTDVTPVPEEAEQPSLPDVVVKVATSPGPCEPEETPVRDQVVETHCTIGAQVIIPFFIAGMGMVGAGFYLDMVQRWKVFVNVPEIIILVPALLGLKGNLEMTLASRLSTEANLGHMDEPKEQWSMILGNLTLVQCQAIVVGLLSAVVAVIMVAIQRQEVDLSHTMLLCSCSIITSSIASLVLATSFDLWKSFSIIRSSGREVLLFFGITGLITATVIVISRCFRINPDNVATPIAASLGDITSLALLSWVASLMYDAMDKANWISPVIVVCYILVIPFWVWIAKKNKYTNSVLYTGWTPVILAMLISTVGGLILGILMASYSGIAIFQPVMNGVGGNLVSVQASRLATALHKANQLGTLPPGSKICVTPIDAFFSKEQYATTARVLMFLVIPGHLTFVYTIRYFQTGDVSLTFLFVLSYLVAAVIQVAVLLYMAYVITYFFWKRQIDPDNSTIPYLTALGDLLGICLLGISFEFLSLMGDEESTSMGH